MGNEPIPRGTGSITMPDATTRKRICVLHKDYNHPLTAICSRMGLSREVVKKVLAEDLGVKFFQTGRRPF